MENPQPKAYKHDDYGILIPVTNNPLSDSSLYLQISYTGVELTLKTTILVNEAVATFEEIPKEEALSALYKSIRKVLWLGSGKAQTTPYTFNRSPDLNSGVGEIYKQEDGRRVAMIYDEEFALYLHKIMGTGV